MHVAYFTERPYRWVDEDDLIRNKAYFALPNAQFDHVRGAEDYNYFLDEYVFAEEIGFDGVALNEHHGNPFCMGSVMNVEAAILARITQRVKIILIGNPLPVIKHPLRMAEELATIDLISRGRLVTGWVRGAGSEQFFNNANPAYNREMFEEAWEFIMQAWTRPGPWRYEGKHFHYRHVNPWVLPYQKPTPPTMIPGVLSPETVRWAAGKSLPYIGLGTSLGPTADLWDIYADVAADAGYQAGPENFGYLIPTFVADTDEKAQELGKGFIYGGGQTVFSQPQYTLPPGYNSKDAIRRLSKQPGGSWLGVNRNKLMQAASGDDDAIDFDAVRARAEGQLRKSQRNYLTLLGSPDTIIEKVKTMISVLRPGTFVFFGPQGPVSNEDRMRNVELLGKYVMPEIKEYAASIGLHSPFEMKPGENKLRTGEARSAVVDKSPLAGLGLDG
ncbi:MAG: LLM class flavin-dependent oxidoreductase [Acidimicrobiia bacterium]|nr:LLM class flavin-dependent oxidoreductase [Acidimicrobiia bacterium]